MNVNTAPIAAGGLALAAVAAGGYALSRRNRSRKARQELERKLREAREGVGTIIADLGRRFNDSDEKAKFDRVSYAPDDVSRLQSLQAQAKQAFVAVQNRFDDIGEQLDRSEQPNEAQIGEATTGYLGLQGEATKVSEQLAAIEKLRVDLDKQAQGAREAIDRAKKS